MMLAVRIEPIRKRFHRYAESRNDGFGFTPSQQHANQRPTSTIYTPGIPALNLELPDSDLILTLSSMRRGGFSS
jgi:hypothetical protein